MRLLVGFAIGLVTAGFGAWKDTLYEGFNSWKFLRSPALAGAAGITFALTFPAVSWVFVAAAASTSERLIVEIWKSVKHEKPGKFLGGQERDRGWLLKRLGRGVS